MTTAQLTSIPHLLYETQLNLAARGLVVEFIVVLSCVFLVSIFRCTEHSSVSWKRTDYVYFTLTIIGAAVGLVDFSVSSWVRETQNLRISRAGRIDQLIGGAKLIAAQCDRDDRFWEEFAQEKDGILTPPKPSSSPSNSLRIISSGGGPECHIARTIGEAIDKKGIANFGAFTATMIPDKDKIIALKNGDSTSYIIEHEDESHPDTGFVTLIMEPLIQIRMMDDRISQLESDANSISYVTWVKHLYPMLFGVGIGIRLGRTHYDVMMEKKKIVPDITLSPGASSEETAASSDKGRSSEIDDTDYIV